MDIQVNIKKKEFNRVIFEDVSLNLKQNHFYMLIAPSGSGKTTLFNMLIGEDNEYDGDIFYGDTLLSLSNISKIRQDTIGILFQNFELSNQLTAYQNVLLSATISKINLKNIRSKIKKLFSELQISDCVDKKISELSTGQKQRVAFARVMVKEPKFIICDEPTGNLDEENEKILMDYLYAYYLKHHCTILMATHNTKLKSYATDILTIKDQNISTLKESKMENEDNVISKRDRKYYLFPFYKQFFENNFSHYVMLSFFMSVCMIGMFISFNFGHDLIGKIENFLETDEQVNTISIQPNIMVGTTFPENSVEILSNLEYVQSVKGINTSFGVRGSDVYVSFENNTIFEEDSLTLRDILDFKGNVYKGKNIENPNDILMTTNLAKKFDLNEETVIGKTFHFQIPVASKYIDEMEINLNGDGGFTTRPDVVFIEDDFTVVGLVDNVKPWIYFDSEYINNTLKEVAKPLLNANESSNLSFASLDVIVEHPQYLKKVANEIEKINPIYKAFEGNQYQNLEFILQERNIFFFVEIIVYVILIYSIIEIQKLNFQRKKQFLHMNALLGARKKDIRNFFILEGMLFFSISALMTYSINILCLNALNDYFIEQSFMQNIAQFVGHMNVVYMDLPIFMSIIGIHLVFLILLQYFYYRKVTGGQRA